ncbi:M48 family metallopeptidase [Aquabacterium sp. A7-Y]|uniref:M48 family metallopeptidase n=1 Tax=Aquabacterium sp. A7-Y TaxID=1349605 RepID=UPI00223D1C56|nr:SprT family zinc-dependent metalloprotease [Aquabacterium sp. A7-Y]MCW7537255.1 M48 family metallopeptidase [Aquabacterium sp. A7-Y]
MTRSRASDLASPQLALPFGPGGPDAAVEAPPPATTAEGGVAAPPAPVAPAPAGATGPAIFHHPRAVREIVLDGQRVAYDFRRAKRRSIGFIVSTEGLSVSAPRWVAVAEIESALQDKAGWILRKLAEQGERNQRLQQARVEWRDGTSLPFLGETLTVVLDPRVSGAVLNTDATALPGVPRLMLHVGLPQQAGAAQIRDLVQSWLQRQARAVFEERCRHFAERLGVRYERLALSSAQTRWGSASADGSIRLNWRLIHFALPTIDYVVAHELAHLREMNHSPRFWDVVRSVMPDYQQVRGTLKETVLPVLD